MPWFTITFVVVCTYHKVSTNIQPGTVDLFDTAFKIILIKWAICTKLVFVFSSEEVNTFTCIGIKDKRSEYKLFMWKPLAELEYFLCLQMTYSLMLILKNYAGIWKYLGTLQIIYCTFFNDYVPLLIFLKTTLIFK